MTRELERIVSSHNAWLEGHKNGRRADLRWANLRWANLGGANLSESNLSEADLSGSNLIRANLSEADLRDANLRWADLREANLRVADLSGANLRGADLSKANLSKADLSEADLRGANLSMADLSEADLKGADLSGANLSGTIGIKHIGFDPRGWTLVMWMRHGKLWCSAGCRSFDKAGALAHWGSPDYPDPNRGQQYVRAINFLGDLGRPVGKEYEDIVDHLSSEKNKLMMSQAVSDEGITIYCDNCGDAAHTIINGRLRCTVCEADNNEN